jgi:hypothetical protein
MLSSSALGDPMSDKKVQPPGGAGFGTSIKKVLGVPGGVVKDAAGAMLNTSRFLTNRQYRCKIGYPWLKETVVRNKNAVWREVSESDELLRLMWRFARGETLTDEEQKRVRQQLLDLAIVVPALGIFALPGGAVLLPMLARALPWDLLPSSFREKEGISEEDLKEIGRGRRRTPGHHIDQANKDSKDLESLAADGRQVS